MTKSFYLKYLFFTFSSILSLVSFAQQPIPSDTTQSKKLNIIRADRLSYFKKDSAQEFQSLAGNVLVRQNNTLFYCDSAVVNTNTNVLESFGHVHINDHDSLHIYADYLKYEGSTKLATLNGNIQLKDNRGVLSTPQLNYNLDTKIASYSNGGKLVNGNTTLTSKEAIYYEETRDVYFKRDVVLINPDYVIHTDTLLYNTYSEITTFTVPTTIISDSGHKKILTSDGYYDLKNKKSYFGKRPQIFDGNTVLIADEVANDDSDSSGFGEANGNVIFRDTAQGYTILANNMKTNRKESAVLATVKPVLIFIKDQDSMVIAADTFFTAKLSNLRKERVVPVVMDTSGRDSLYTPPILTDSTDHYFEAYSHVRIFSDSMQAIGDSLFYALDDSVIRLFKKPVLWAQGNQVTGDTVYLFTKNKKPDRLYVFNNAMVISKMADEFFNQVKGRTINGYFINGNMDYMRTRGSPAESIYYAQDDADKFIGVNKSSADAYDIHFENKKPMRISGINDLKGMVYPMRQVNHIAIRLQGFQWLESLRPKSKYDLFGE
ncbi:MAG: hypothetical protein JSS67_03865 [Bacteroidetes bacterium]|nr:hypothetical protein [Bacteroidota bacterium]